MDGLDDTFCDDNSGLYISDGMSELPLYGAEANSRLVNLKLIIVLLTGSLMFLNNRQCVHPGEEDEDHERNESSHPRQPSLEH